MIIFRTIAKISQIYCWGILIWATLYIPIMCAGDRIYTCFVFMMSASRRLWNIVIVYRFILAPFYVNKNTTDFICSTPGYGGMTTCDDVPPFRLNGIECNETLESLFGINLWNHTSDISFNASSSCINWNAYYTECRPGSANPFQGSISFDNIFLAWIAIFQVMHLLL